MPTKKKIKIKTSREYVPDDPRFPGRAIGRLKRNVRKLKREAGTAEITIELAPRREKRTAARARETIYEGTEPTYHPLRATLDGLEVWYDRRVSRERWEELRQTVESGDVLIVDLLKSSGKTSGSLSFRGRFLKGAALKFTDERLGITVEVRQPLPPNHSATQTSAGVVVKMPGRAFQSRLYGFSMSRKIVRSLDAVLFPDLGSSVDERSKRLGLQRTVRDFHLAVDVAVRGAGATTWIDEELFRGHNPKAAREPWATRSKAASKATESDKDNRQLEHGHDGWTLSLNGSCIRFSVYEKDKEPKSWERVRDVLTTCGLLPGDRVVRAEWKCGPEWLRQEKSDGRSVTKLSFDEFLDALPELAERLGERYRHATPGKGAKTRWTTTPFGEAIESALKGLEERGTGALKSVAVQAVDVQKRVADSRKRLVRELWRQLACGGPGGAPLADGEVHAMVTRELTEEVPAEAVVDRMNRLRRDYGLPPLPQHDPATPAAITDGDLVTPSDADREISDDTDDRERTVRPHH